MIGILIGAPGSGKGTQSAALCARFGFQHFSTGDIFRAEIAAKTPLGTAAAAYMNKGQLVPDGLVTEMVALKLAEPQSGRYLLDGFPRNVAQAEALAELLSRRQARVDVVLFLDLAREAAVQRLTSRRLCGACGEVFNVLSRPPKTAGKCDRCGQALVQRDDDTEATALERLKVYEGLTRPLIAHYRAQGILHEVDAGRSPEAVTAGLMQVVEPLLAAR